MELLLTVLDVVLLGCVGYNVYWQSQIEVRANYAYMQMFWGVVFAILIASTYTASWAYVVFLALFVLLNVSAGYGGIASDRIVGYGMFQRVLRLSTLAGVTILPVQTVRGRQLVIVVFAFNPRRYVRMTFRQPLEALTVKIRQMVPENVPVEIQQVQ
ncbi:hypothetical protein [Lacticaseibacillus pantheris]|jgi:hypothetical protein